MSGHIIQDLKDISPQRWLFLALGVVIDALGVAMVSNMNLGVSAVSSVAYALNKAFPAISFGTWSYIFQTCLVLILIAITHRVRIQYVLAFVLSIAFGYILDFMCVLTLLLPGGIVFRCIWCAVGIFCIALGVCLMVESDLPIIPQDMFARELSRHKNWRFRTTKTVFDLSCVATSCLVGLVMCGGIGTIGIGAGTLVSALVMGSTINFIRNTMLKLGIIKTSIVR